jgi:archaellin
MAFSSKALAWIMAATFSGIAHADIYESKDDQGNPVFTDTPSAGSEQVDLQKSNIADAVEAPAETVREAEAAHSPSGKTQDAQGKVIVIEDERNEELSRAIDADRPHEVLEAEKRYEVGDNVTAQERARREAAKTGKVVNKDGNVEIIKHQGHVGGRR